MFGEDRGSHALQGPKPFHSLRSSFTSPETIRWTHLVSGTLETYDTNTNFEFYTSFDVESNVPEKGFYDKNCFGGDTR